MNKEDGKQTPKPKSVVLEVQSVKHVLNLTTNPQKKENKNNG